jgi:integrase
MTVQTELREYLDTSHESMRALSLRAGIGVKAVSDIMNIPGLRPKHKTLVALTEATGVDLVAACEHGKPQTFGQLLEILKASGKTNLASRVSWLLGKAGWYENRIVCRQEVLGFFAANNAASLELKKGSRSTYKSDILSAIDRYGERNRRRGVADLRGIMADVYEAAKSEDIPVDCRRKAGPFFLFLDDNKLAPAQVTTDVVAEYYAHRLRSGVLDEKKCRKHVQNVVDLIGHLAKNPATCHFGFVPVASPFSDGRDKFEVENGLLDPLLAEFDARVAPWVTGKASRDGMPYEDFLGALDREEVHPVSDKKARLRAKVAAKKALTKKERTEERETKLRQYGFLTHNDRWSERTLATRRGYVISLAKALSASCDIILNSIDELTDPEYLEAAAEALAEANKSSESGYVASVLKSVKKIAVGFVARNSEDIERIKVLIRHHATKKRGIAASNKNKLHKFTADRIQNTIDLSGIVMKGINAEVARRRTEYRKVHGVLPQPIDVIDVEMARDIAAMVAHDILIKRAPRSANVIGMKLDWIAFQDGRARITIPAIEVKMRGKDDADYVVPLGEKQSQLLRQYIDRVRPKLLLSGDAANPYLFPRQGLKSFKPNLPYSGLLLRVTQRLFDIVGVEIHPHLYRHLIGWIWLKESMENLTKVQKLLGHKSLRTTLEYYAELDESLVFDEWQQFLDRESNPN